MRHYEKAIEEGKKAIALDPNSADANVHFARTLIFAGRSEEAILLINKAIRLNPFAPTWYYQLLGNAYCVTDQYDEAITACKKALNIQPDNLFAHIFLAVAYASLSNEDDASNEVKEILRLNPKYSVKYFGMTFNYEDKTDKERIINSLRKAGLPE